MNPPVSEEIIEPALPIVDPHHHLRDRAGDRYLFEDLRRDLASGHNIIATVVIECGDMYRDFGPPQLRPVGESQSWPAQEQCDACRPECKGGQKNSRRQRQRVGPTCLGERHKQRPADPRRCGQ